MEPSRVFLRKETPLDSAKAPLLPKLRGHFAEFLRPCFSIRLSILYLTTGVGYKYGFALPKEREEVLSRSPGAGLLKSLKETCRTGDVAASKLRNVKRIPISLRSLPEP